MKFWFENLKERDHLEDLDIDGKILEIGWEVVDWMHQALVNTVMNIQVPYKAGHI
jgi:hypothetical protein